MDAEHRQEIVRLLRAAAVFLSAAAAIAGSVESKRWRAAARAATATAAIITAACDWLERTAVANTGAAATGHTEKH